MSSLGKLASRPMGSGKALLLRTFVGCRKHPRIPCREHLVWIRRSSCGRQGSRAGPSPSVLSLKIYSNDV